MTLDAQQLWDSQKNLRTRLWDALEEAVSWQKEAACLGVDPNIFYAERGNMGNKQVKEAKTICSMCTVSEECLEFALETHEKYGIWGGKTDKERRQIRYQRDRAERLASKEQVA